MSKKTFDEICSKILGEGVPVSPATAGQTPVQNPAIQKQTTPQPTPSANQQQINDDDLLKLLQQKLADEKFKQSLMQMLNPQANG